MLSWTTTHVTLLWFDVFLRIFCFFELLCSLNVCVCFSFCCCLLCHVYLQCTFKINKSNKLWAKSDSYHDFQYACLFTLHFNWFEINDFFLHYEKKNVISCIDSFRCVCPMNINMIKRKNVSKWKQWMVTIAVTRKSTVNYREKHIYDILCKNTHTLCLSLKILWLYQFHKRSYIYLRLTMIKALFIKRKHHFSNELFAQRWRPLR